MQKKPFFKPIALYLAFAMVLLTMPSQGWAMFISSDHGLSARQNDMAAIQKTLESTVVKQRLMDFGLSAEEAMERINSLSDDQVHQFAGEIDSLQAGSDAVGALVFLLLVAIIVVVVLQATGHRVIIK